MAKMASLHAELTELPDYEKGIQAERERIIKLLENDQCRPDERFHFAPCACKYIALIKGSN